MTIKPRPTAHSPTLGMQKVTNRVALITGASLGLGRSMAIHLAERGIGDIDTYRSDVAEAGAFAREVENRGVKAVALALHVSDMHAFPTFVDAVARVPWDTFGRDQLDCLVNNAGIGLRASLAIIEPAQFDGLVSVNVRGPLLLTQHLLPLDAHGGRILNVSSAFVRFTLPGYGTYAAVKAATEILTRIMALELSERRIRVNAIAPGAVATDLVGGSVRDNEAANAAVARSVALGRVELPDDIGYAVAAMVSDDSRWANGASFEIFGGQLL